ncbi:MAG TPA: hypothetical protein VHC46_04755 [Thermodesulfobacteriota bacterium]|nr:hypothetical protein [Candidatus Paceibacterota bacterium]HVY55046.1 hypothetical protein [Thermodesulfobacteriota bacterium]
MKLKIVVFLLLLAFAAPFSFPDAAFAAPGLSIGGTVLFQYVCNTGLLLYIKSATPPYAVMPLMWLWGELPFSKYIPPHPGQQILGVAAPTVVPCVLGYVPIGVGFPILFHGSSI